MPQESGAADAGGGTSLEPTRASTWRHPWVPGGSDGLSLSPLDNTFPLKRELAHVPMCTAPVGSLGVLQSQTQTLPCAACPQGYGLGADGSDALECTQTPDCPGSGGCSTCQIDPQNPFYAGPCSACIDYGCNPHSNRCSCA